MGLHSFVTFVPRGTAVSGLREVTAFSERQRFVIGDFAHLRLGQGMQLCRQVRVPEATLTTRINDIIVQGDQPSLEVHLSACLLGLGCESSFLICMSGLLWGPK